MSTDPPEPLTPDRSGDEALKGPDAPQPSSGPSTPVPVPEPVRRRRWGWALAAGLLAGLLTGVAGEVSWREIRSAQSPRIVAFPTAEDRARVIDGQVRSTAVSFIRQGTILGAILGLAGGVVRRSVWRGLVATAAGLALGGAAAAVAARVLLPFYFLNVEPEENALLLPLLTHGGLWTAIGAAAGLAFGLGLGGRGRWARGALGGLLGGVSATVVYELVGALAFPIDKTSQPVSATVVTRLFAQLAVAVFVAAGAALGTDDATRRAPPAP
jgi:hypothetical protein